MTRQEAAEEYGRALRQGQREMRDIAARHGQAHPVVLDQILEGKKSEGTQLLPVMDIPMDRIRGTVSAGRITAFTPSFRPLLEPNSEFGAKWINLCAAHLSSEGIREPIVCMEYLGDFYIQEGNKRVSVLRHFGAPRISAQVTRILPQRSQEPRILAYYEFLEFYRVSGIYDIQFRQPGQYDKLLAALGKDTQESWDDREQRQFRAYFQYFREAYTAHGGDYLATTPEEALLLWLKVHPFRDLGRMSAGELNKSLGALWDDVLAMGAQEPIRLETEPADNRGIISRLMNTSLDHVQVAFVHPLDSRTSIWVKGHEEGRLYLARVLGSKVTTRSYFQADTLEAAEKLLDQAVADGAQVVFTTATQLSRATLKAAVKYPKVRFLNCSVATPYSSIRTYYSRIYEGKFITGAIAGAMAQNDRIGYVGSEPIFGVPASINAFALGAQMTNPRAKIELLWSCQQGVSPVQQLVGSGIRVISNRDVLSQDQIYLQFGEYGTYQVEDNGKLTALASPCWVWGKFYEHVVRAILSGAYSGKDSHQAVNYWWGMSSGVIDVTLSDQLPQGLLHLADVLRQGLRTGTLDPFRRRIVAQDGTVKNDGQGTFTADQLLKMDWLCENVQGSIPEFHQILPVAQPIVRELGIYRDRIPAQREVSL